MKGVKIGVAGVGSMGRNHCRILQNMKNVNFIGVYDPDRQSSEQISQKYMTRSFKTYKELLKEVDAVIIAAPTSVHHSLTEQAIQEERHVLVEKPFVASVEEAEKIRTLLQEKRVILQVGHVERFNPAVQQLYELIHLGEIISIETRRQGAPQRNIDVDVILDLMIHDIDIILHLANSPVCDVSAVGASLSKGCNIDVASALLTFENGIIANLVANRISQEKIRTLSITEVNRFIQTNYLTKELHVYQKTNLTISENATYRLESLVEKVVVPNAEPLFLEVSEFIQSIQTTAEPQVGLAEATKALEIALKIKEAINSK